MDVEFGQMMDELVDAMGDASEETVREVTDDLLAESRIVVPYQEGDLSRAGHAEVRQVGVAGAQGEVRYDIVYARYQELREDLRHQDSGTAHYLGGTMKANSGRYMDHLGRVWDKLA
ncbi:hypothetical protein [Actinosynnema mirum]|uniref:HK97 gp10 family phage protein n=1 Tax=Actinosynnema mirum (strain ATCC 29888 / DSM 43827 / JCM 3225 / NBRC 14064 / NCIMB 13271 / NRRL B-12336 / IMRU 3971 / 101) TaxID=446462 RepID=C6WBL7_ACTMD|nr:hypothetical protein [Actinosynnema mirum]ACU35585.1 hypothetical protein Amir_1636 [Actinosynnema mirum DSM 43827]